MLEWGTSGKRGIWEEMSGNLAWTVWVGTQKVTWGNDGGGPHHCLPRRVELIWVPVASNNILSLEPLHVSLAHVQNENFTLKFICRDALG